jgi:hypothetical protein
MQGILTKIGFQALNPPALGQVAKFPDNTLSDGLFGLSILKQ